MGNSTLEHAMFLAELGYPIVLLSPRGKIPIVDFALGLTAGLKNASSDPNVIRKWFSKHPKANIGIALPPKTIVLDLDDENSLQPLIANYPSLNRAPLAKTGNGGWHIWTSAPDGITATARALPHYSLDLRTGGRSYVVVPPSIHPNGQPYRWLRPLTKPPRSLPLLPPGILAQVKKYRSTISVDPSAPPPKPIPPPRNQGLARRQRKYALVELANRSDEMRRTPPGSRHDKLFRHAVALTGWYRAGALESDEILNQLSEAAIASGLGPRETYNTITWALKHSQIQPRTLPSPEDE